MDSGAVTAVWDTQVSGQYRQFGLHDPTCEESENIGTAITGASGRMVGWATNALMVNVVYDLVHLSVRVEVLDGEPPHDDTADGIEEGQLALPGGVVGILYAMAAEWRLGVTLPSGAGTYAVRVLGYGRERARRIWNDRGAPEEFEGVESYRIQLWRLSPEPSWVSDDDDDDA
jgi:hypothetical protein